ncbi:hypothetical protein [Planctomicrobium sp. SH664]|uniref:hypothetical protein n=1 Tax=Planctomicrobium sp. SH664 TaxID=3448125 RepID=UPI003F5C0018
MQLWRELLNDEAGVVPSSEAVVVGGVAIAGATVGLPALANSEHNQLQVGSVRIRSLDQGHSIAGRKTANAWSTGSDYLQNPVAETIAEFRHHAGAKPTIGRAVEQDVAPLAALYLTSQQPLDLSAPGK